MRLPRREISEKVKQCCPIEAEVSVFYHIKKIYYFLFIMKTSCLILSLWTSNLMFPLELRHQNRLTPGIQTVQIIYITNYTNYFTSVYETSHIYYILKKDIDTYLSTALKKAIQQIAKINQYYLIIQSKQQHIRIAQSKILYLERIMRTTNIHTADTIYQTPEKMDSLLERLCPWFCPSHRSYIVKWTAHR